MNKWTQYLHHNPKQICWWSKFFSLMLNFRNKRRQYDNYKAGKKRKNLACCGIRQNVSTFVSQDWRLPLDESTVKIFQIHCGFFAKTDRTGSSRFFLGQWMHVTNTETEDSQHRSAVLFFGYRRGRQQNFAHHKQQKATWKEPMCTAGGHLDQRPKQPPPILDKGPFRPEASGAPFLQGWPKAVEAFDTGSNLPSHKNTNPKFRLSNKSKTN